MKASRVFLGLGSNLADPPGQLTRAMTLLERSPDLKVVAYSRLYRTSPWGRPGQPEYVNAVVEVRTRLLPVGLLAMLQELESVLGRSRQDDQPWGPRLIDLDLLAFGRRRVCEAALKVPHPRVAERRFVLAPWAEIAPEFRLPGLGTVAALLAACGDPGTVVPLAKTELGGKTARHWGAPRG